LKSSERKPAHRQVIRPERSRPPLFVASGPFAAPSAP
jgi:hypothetical protein